MGLDKLKPAEGSKGKAFRVGRGQGSGNGKTAGRGHKGAQSRSGYKSKRGFEGGQMPLHRRIPKRGFTNIFRREFAVVNVDRIAELLRERGLVPAGAEPVKVLARGDVAKALTIKAHKFSGKAAEKIAAAGGATELL
jgi:large subunit ribosomal protein L15